MNRKKIGTLMILVAFAAPAWGMDTKREERIDNLINSIASFNVDYPNTESIDAIQAALFGMTYNEDCQHLKRIDKKRIRIFINEKISQIENAGFKHRLKNLKRNLKECVLEE